MKWVKPWKKVAVSIVHLELIQNHCKPTELKERFKHVEIKGSSVFNTDLLYKIGAWLWF